jgi:hypothetical protein
MKNLKRAQLLSLSLILLSTGLAFGAELRGGDLVMTKNLLGASGFAAVRSSTFSLSLALGEPIAGGVIRDSRFTLLSGYYAGGFSNGMPFSIISTQIGRADARNFFQDGVQVGVSLDAPVTITFSDQLNESSLATAIRVTAIRDRLGASTRINIPIDLAYNPETRSVVITPQESWNGNTFYEILVTSDLVNLDDGPLESVFQIYFLTLLDPAQENVVLHPVQPNARALALMSDAREMTIHISPQSLSDYSAVLLNRDPLTTALGTDALTIEEANRKAVSAGGLYRRPLLIHEIAAFNAQGDVLGPLQETAEITFRYGEGFLSQASGLVRPETFAIWMLDSKHRLWVRLASSRHNTMTRTVTARVAYFSVFAVMGESAESASHSFAFPIPWRPQGPQSGEGVDRSGSEAGGITFSNIPSECSIRIFTLSGKKVQELHHSDINSSIGQETWDVRTSQGDAVASGVYLWQVESKTDSKSGKLMVIR